MRINGVHAGSVRRVCCRGRSCLGGGCGRAGLPVLKRLPALDQRIDRRGVVSPTTWSSSAQGVGPLRDRCWEGAWGSVREEQGKAEFSGIMGSLGTGGACWTAAFKQGCSQKAPGKGSMQVYGWMWGDVAWVCWKVRACQLAALSSWFSHPRIRRSSRGWPGCGGGRGCGTAASGGGCP